MLNVYMGPGFVPAIVSAAIIAVVLLVIVRLGLTLRPKRA